MLEGCRRSGYDAGTSIPHSKRSRRYQYCHRTSNWHASPKCKPICKILHVPWIQCFKHIFTLQEHPCIPTRKRPALQQMQLRVGVVLRSSVRTRCPREDSHCHAVSQPLLLFACQESPHAFQVHLESNGGVPRPQQPINVELHSSRRMLDWEAVWQHMKTEKTYGGALWFVLPHSQSLSPPQNVVRKQRSYRKRKKHSNGKCVDEMVKQCCDVFKSGGNRDSKFLALC